MFPIRDHNPSERTPFVTYALMAANILIFLSYLPLFENGAALNRFFFEWALIPARLTQGGEGYHTLVSSTFLHGGWMHLGGNMLFLWIFGDNLEDDLGHVGFLAFYLASGVGAGLVQVASDPGSFVPVVGASGAIAGVMGGYLLFYPRAKVDVLFILVIIFKIIPIPAWVMLGVWFALQLFNGTVTDQSGGGVAYWAHAGGFVIGLVLLLPAWLKRGGTAFWERTDGHPDHPEAEYQLSRSRVPTVRRRPRRKGPWR